MGGRGERRSEAAAYLASRRPCAAPSGPLEDFFRQQLARCQREASACLRSFKCRVRKVHDERVAGAPNAGFYRELEIEVRGAVGSDAHPGDDLGDDTPAFVPTLHIEE